MEEPKIEQGKSVNEKLGDRMKKYEQATEAHLDKNLPFIVRIDGHSFSKFTKGLATPFDHYFAMAMIQMTADLKTHWKADIAYTQSDESTFIFFPKKQRNTDNLQELPFRGRIIKIATLFSGLATARFNFHLVKYLESQDNEKLEDIKVHYEDQVFSMLPQKKFEYSKKTLNKVFSMNAHFDARVFNVPSENEVVNNLYWRSGVDCVRNSVSRISCFYFSYKENFGKNTREKKQMLLEKGYDWEKENPAFKYGVFIKTEKYEKEVEFYRQGEKNVVNAVRTRNIVFSLKMNMKDLPSLLQLFKLQDFDESARSLYFQKKTETPEPEENIDELDSAQQEEPEKEETQENQEEEN